MTTTTGTPRWFRPPRPHGHVIVDRSVTFIELFYDLVFVVLIAQLAHTLADHVTWTGVRDFVVVFGLVWFAWLNGTLYHDLHGGEDGRSRTYIFLQMGILALMAVFAAHAADDNTDGRWFAVLYAALVLLIGWQWFDVRRFDTPQWRDASRPYVVGAVLIALVVLASAAVNDPEARVLIWAAAVVTLLLGGAAPALRPAAEEMAKAMHPTESLVERFGLFTIIVLGEVVVGVVDGISEVSPTFLPIATGLLALNIGFGFWWNYFDLVGGRVPAEGRARVPWLAGHLPLAIGISGAGAGMVGLIEHASDGRTPAATAWLVGGSTALVAVSIAVLSQVIDPHPARRAVPFTLVATAAVAVVAAAVRPAPWALALILTASLSAVWLEAFTRHVRHDVTITDRV